MSCAQTGSFWISRSIITSSYLKQC